MNAKLRVMKARLLFIFSLLFLVIGCSKHKPLLDITDEAYNLKLQKDYNANSNLFYEKILIDSLKSHTKDKVPPPSLFSEDSLLIKIKQAKNKMPHKGIYINFVTSSNEKKMNEVIKYVNETELNCLVIDMKLDTGPIIYDTKVPLAKNCGAKMVKIKDINAFVENLKKHDIYLIARIAVFSDPILARYDLGDKKDIYSIKDRYTGVAWVGLGGAQWTDPYCKEVWEYNVSIAKELAEAGFDEIQFDYIRFPSDGKIENCTYSYYWGNNATKEDAIEGFLEYAYKELKPLGVSIAADVYGFSAWHGGLTGIGQDVVRMGKYLDTLCPMYYPSHFPMDFMMEDRETRDYRIVKKGCEIAEKRMKPTNTKVQPFIQGFKWRAVPRYDVDYIMKQIQAAEDGGATGGWLIWEAGNNYELTWEALLRRKEMFSNVNGSFK